MKTWTQADELAYEAKHAARKTAEEEAFQARGGQPPRQSQVNGPPLDWKRWNGLLDGIPAANIYALDADEGWVEVYVTGPGHGSSVCRILGEPRRRLHGKVTVVTCEEWTELAKVYPPIVLDKEHLRGDPVPGTELRFR